jgi:hypothetical protein
VKNCVKLLLCSIYFTVFSNFAFAITLSEDNFDRIFNNSYNAWFANRDHWKTSIENKNEKILMLDVFLNEQEIEFLPKLFPIITTLAIRVDKKNSFSHEEELFFGDLEWEEGESDFTNNKNQTKFTELQIEKLLNIYPSLTTFKLIDKNDIQLWLNNLNFLKKLTHLSVEIDVFTNDHLQKLHTLNLKYLKLTYVSSNINIKMLDKINCHIEVIKK